MQHELICEFYLLQMIPPRGCAYVCMKERLEADKALHKIKHCRLNGKVFFFKVGRVIKKRARRTITTMTLLPSDENELKLNRSSA